MIMMIVTIIIIISITNIVIVTTTTTATTSITVATIAITWLVIIVVLTITIMDSLWKWYHIHALWLTVMRIISVLHPSVIDILSIKTIWYLIHLLLLT